MKTEIVQLIPPSVDFKESYLACLSEFQAEGLAWVMDKNLEEIGKNFAAYVAAEKNKRTLWTQDEPVPESIYWAILAGEVVGDISIRHRLNADLKIMGGHIGYDTRPAYRGRGVATSMLRQALPIAKSLGIESAMLTCNDTNLASIRVIEKNGGKLRETKPQFPGGPLKRYYWIELGE